MPMVSLGWYLNPDPLAEDGGPFNPIQCLWRGREKDLVWTQHEPGPEGAGGCWWEKLCEQTDGGEEALSAECPSLSAGLGRGPSSRYWKRPVQQESFGRSLPGLDSKPPSGTWRGGKLGAVTPSRGGGGDARGGGDRGHSEEEEGAHRDGEGRGKKLLCQTLKHQVSTRPGRINKTGHHGLQPVATRGPPKRTWSEGLPLMSLRPNTVPLEGPWGLSSDPT